MKKLLLLAAFGLLASPALAQSNVASTSSTGDDNDATITQVGTLDFAKIEQGSAFASDDNDATISQSGGQDNRAFIRQNGDENLSTITQIGTEHDALSETSPGTDIRGNRNHTDIYQEGYGNYARIRVTGDDNGDVSGNALEVDQIGQLNRGQVFFTGDNNQGFVDQTTGDDQNYVFFSAGTAVPTDVSGRPGITASNNTVEFTQSGGATATGYLGGDGNEIYVNQSGTDNSIGTRSESSFDGINVYGDDNDIFVDQTMSSNNATVNIDGLTFGTRGNLNTVNVDQHSSSNMADVDIMGSGNTSTISQN